MVTELMDASGLGETLGCESLADFFDIFLKRKQMRSIAICGKLQFEDQLVLYARLYRVLIPSMSTFACCMKKFIRRSRQPELGFQAE